MTRFKGIKYLVLLVLGVVLLTGCSGKTAGDSQPQNNSAPAKAGFSRISTSELQAKLGKADWVVVDTRINDAFNGWALEGVARGGHISGATDFSANWLKVKEKDVETRLAKILKDKGITAEKNVVLYDANGKDALAVAEYLKSKGITKISLYDVRQWAADSALPMKSYPNYQMVVPASWIDHVIKTNNKVKAYKVFEVSWGKVSEDYKKGHIQGAVHLNTDEVEEGPIWNRISNSRLEKFAANNGITTDTTVVLYGADPMPAYRVGAIMKYMGVKDVRILNGGYAAWASAGNPVETKENPKAPVAAFGAKVPVNSNYIVDLPQAKQILADKAGSRLVDIRSWDEYIGKTPGYKDITAKGRPAGAVWGHAGTDSGNLQDFRNVDNTMRNGSEILKMWKDWDITPDKRLAFYCGTGWRAAEVQIYADVMGLKNTSLYDGGWYEWSANKANPVEIGDPRSK